MNSIGFIESISIEKAVLLPVRDENSVTVVKTAQFEDGDLKSPKANHRFWDNVPWSVQSIETDPNCRRESNGRVERLSKVLHCYYRPIEYCNVEFQATESIEEYGQLPLEIFVE